MTSTPRPSLKDVLSAFAVEASSGENILASYLKEYPEYAEDLVDLSWELQRAVSDDETPLSVEDRSLIEAAWKRFSDGASAVLDPLAALSVTEIRHVAETLGIKRQILAAFREHRVIVASIPSKFFSRLAAAAGSTVEQLRHALSVPVVLGPARAYKADSTPEAGGPVTFEQLLIEAGHSEAERAALMSEGE